MPDPRNMPANAALTEPMSWGEGRDSPGIAPPATVARQAQPCRRVELVGTVDQGERTKRAPEGVWWFGRGAAMRLERVTLVICSLRACRVVSKRVWCRVQEEQDGQQ